MAETLSSKIKIGLEIDTSKAKAQLETLLIGATANINVNADVSTQGKPSSQATGTNAANINQSLDRAAASINTAARNIERSTQQRAGARERITQAATQPTIGGGGGGGGGRGPTTTSYTSLGGRGDRAGIIGRIGSVAQYYAASAALNSVFKGFGKGMSVVADVNQELSQLNKILNTSKSKLDDLKNSAVNTAKEFGLSTKQVLQGYKVFAQQGLQPNEVKKLGRTVAMASNVSTFGTEGLSELIVAAKQLYPKQEVGDTGEKLIDTFLKVEGKFAVSEGDLADVFKRIGAQASVAGLSVSELSALTTVMKERTRAPSGEIATSLRFIIKNLQENKTLTNLNKAFKQFGVGNKVSFYDATGDLRNTFDVLGDIAKIFPSLNRSQKAYVATQIGETRFANKVIALLGGYSKTTDVLNVAQTAQGETMSRNQIVMQSLSKQAGVTGAAFEGFALAFGSNFVDPAITFLKIMTNTFNVMEKMSSLRLFGQGGEGGTPQEGGLPIGGMASAAGGYLALRGAGRFIGNRLGPEAAQRGGMLGKVASWFSGSSAAGTVTKVASTTEGVLKSGQIVEASGVVFAKSLQGAASSANWFTKMLATLGGGMSLLGKGTAVSKTVQATEILGKSAPSIVAGIMLLGKGLFKGINSIVFGDAFKGLFLKAGSFLTGIAGKGLIGGGARAVGGALGWGAGPAGAVASYFATDLIIKGIGRYFESGRQRSERRGLVENQAKAQEGLDVSYKLEDNLNKIADIDKQIQQASKMSLGEQKTAIKSGDLQGTFKDLTKIREDLVKSQRDSFIELSDVIEKTPTLQENFNISPGGNRIGFREDRSKPFTDLKKLDAPTYKQALNLLRSTQTVDRSIAEIGISLESFNENLENDESFKAFDAAYTKARKRADKFGLPGLDISKEQVPGMIGAFGYSPFSIAGLTPKETFALQNRPELRDQVAGGTISNLESLVSASKDTEQVFTRLKAAISGVKTTNLINFLKIIDTKNILATNIAHPGSSARGGRIGPSQRKWSALESIANSPTEMVKFATFTIGEKRKETFAGQEKATVEGTKTIKDAINLAKAGTLLQYKTSSGMDQIAEVVDIEGQRMVNIIEKIASTPIRPGRRVGTASEQLDTNVNVVTKSLESFASEVDRISIGIKKAKPAITGEAGITEKTIFGGIGARQVNEDVLKAGGTYLNELSNQTAGLFTGFKEGRPTFNNEIQTSFTQFSDVIEKLRDAVKTRSLTPEENQQIVQFEGVSLVAKEIDNLGRILKSLEGTFIKFNQAENRRQAQREVSITQTGPLSKLGGEVPQFNLGKDLIDLSPQERAATALSNTAIELGRKQTQLGLLRESRAEFLNVQDDITAAIENVSSEGLSTVNFDKLNEILTGVQADKVDVATLGAFSKESTKDLSQDQRTALVSQFKEFFSNMTSKYGERITSSSARIAKEAQPLEVALKTKTQLEALAMGAESASRSLDSLQKFEGLFDNLQRAKGEGPLGLLGEKQPLYFRGRPEKGIAGAEQLNLKGMNQFEMQRYLIEQRSASGYGRGNNVIFSETGQRLGGLSKREATDQLKVLDLQEQAYRRSMKEDDRRKRIDVAQQGLTSLAGQVQDVLTTRKDLTPTARTGLQSVLTDIQSLGKQNERFFTRGGQARPEILEAQLKSIPQRLERLVPDIGMTSSMEEKDRFKQTVQEMMVQSNNVVINATGTVTGGNITDPAFLNYLGVGTASMKEFQSNVSNFKAPTTETPNTNANNMFKMVGDNVITQPSNINTPSNLYRMTGDQTITRPENKIVDTIAQESKAGSKEGVLSFVGRGSEITQSRIEKNLGSSNKEDMLTGGKEAASEIKSSMIEGGKEVGNTIGTAIVNKLGDILSNIKIQIEGMKNAQTPMGKTATTTDEQTLLSSFITQQADREATVDNRIGSMEELLELLKGKQDEVESKMFDITNMTSLRSLDKDQELQEKDLSKKNVSDNKQDSNLAQTNLEQIGVLNSSQIQELRNYINTLEAKINSLFKSAAFSSA